MECIATAGTQEPVFSITFEVCMTLKYAKRSKLNRMVQRILSASKFEVDDFVLVHLIPQVEEKRRPDLIQMIHSLRNNFLHPWEAGTALANFLGYNVINEDTHETH
ncbi:hypothetical protein [Herbiconiux daphne]|uniref:Uncharacterized protein n=1 Tax=Herbiconiux daphne TaxID=2970914 RepID=A0ABT2H9B9_9MICO|nr:hypothetical protein [Herbiconiux daphne]MCS5736529.1 hypothetical protein [Herbiconiux daphne]